MKIQANGKPAELPAPMSVTRMLETLNVDQPLYVSVQLNDRMLKREEFDATLVQEGDVVEFLYFMGGGGCEKLC